MIITSKTNEKIKYINSLKDKKYRDKYNKYILEGIKLVDEYINRGENIPLFIVMSKELLLSSNGGEAIYNKYKDAPNTLEVDENIFKALTDTVSPQGIFIVVDKKEYGIKEAQNNISGKYIVLDKVQDLGNLGTIIRSAISFGVNNIICIKGTGDMYSPKVVRSAMGALDKVNIYYLDETEFETLSCKLKKENYVLVATELTAHEMLNKVSLTDKSIFVLGNEANGVDEKISKLCDLHVKIPMEDIQESLNVAMAGTILMYEAYTRGNV